MEMPLHTFLKGGSRELVNKVEHKVILEEFTKPEDLLTQDKLLTLS